MALQPNSKPEPAAGGGLAPGVSFFQVLIPSPITAANGDTQYGMAGPFVDLAAANQYASQKPGSLITVTLVLHQVAAAPRPLAAAKAP